MNLNHASRVASGYLDEEEVRWLPFWDVFVARGARLANPVRRGGAVPPRSGLRAHLRQPRRPGADDRVVDGTLYDEQGNVRNVVCGGLDVTERERQLRELQDEAATARRSRPHRSQSSRSTSTTGGPLESRRGAHVRLDRGRDGRRPAPARATRAAGGARDLFARVRSGETARESRARACARTGRDRVEVSAAPIRDAAGNVVGHMAPSPTSPTAGARRRRSAPRGPGSSRPGEGATAPRAQPARRRAAAPGRALAGPPTRPVQGGDRSRARLRPCSSRRERSRRRGPRRATRASRGIHPAVLTDRGLTAALEALASRSPIPVEIDAPEKAPALGGGRRLLRRRRGPRQRGEVRGRERRDRPICRENGRALVEVGDDGVGGADPAAGLACAASPTAWRRSAAPSPSPARRAAAPASAEIPLHASSQTA